MWISPKDFLSVSEAYKLLSVYGQFFCLKKNSQMGSNRRVLDIKSPGPGLFNMGDIGTPSPKLKLVSVKKLVLVKIGEFIKISIGMLLEGQIYVLNIPNIWLIYPWDRYGICMRYACNLCAIWQRYMFAICQR